MFKHIGSAQHGNHIRYSTFNTVQRIYTYNRIWLYDALYRTYTAVGFFAYERQLFERPSAYFCLSCTNKQVQDFQSLVLCCNRILSHMLTHLNVSCPAFFCLFSYCSLFLFKSRTERTPQHQRRVI